MPFFPQIRKGQNRRSQTRHPRSNERASARFDGRISIAFTRAVLEYWPLDPGTLTSIGVRCALDHFYCQDARCRTGRHRAGGVEEVCRCSARARCLEGYDEGKEDDDCNIERWSLQGLLQDTCTTELLWDTVCWGPTKDKPTAEYSSNRSRGVSQS
jgi:hypothetical protein